MKVNNNILLAVISILVFGILSCSKETTIDNTPNNISLFPVPLPSAKSVAGVVTPTSGYPDDESMGVFAYYSPKTGSWSSSDRNSSVSYIDDVEFKKQDTYWAGWENRAPKPYYWPLSGSLIFAGYSPYYQVDGTTRINVSFDPSTKTLSCPEYIIEDYTARNNATVAAANYNDSQSDLMYFLPKVDYTYDFVGVRTPDNAYNAIFHHALSLVEFRVKAASSGDISKIDLHKITLKEVVHKGSFDVVVEDSPEGRGAWTLDRETAAYTKDIVAFDAGKIEGDDNGLTLSTAYASVAQILIIPGLTHEIEIEYRIHVVSGRTITEKSVIKPTEIGITEWLIGKKYSYDISLSVNNIEIEPILNEWL